MNKIYQNYSKHKRLIKTISVLLLVVLFLMPIFTTKHMKIDEEYTKKEDVALYIMQHHELPKNYITKSTVLYAKRRNLSLDGKVVGGDDYWNDGVLENHHISDDKHLKECDIIDNPVFYDLYAGSKEKTGNRGEHRLVYTTNTRNVRVFYTENHYGTFRELSSFSLQLTRNIFWIIFGIFSVSLCAYYIAVLATKNKKEKLVQVGLDLKQIEAKKAIEAQVVEETNENMSKNIEDK